LPLSKKRRKPIMQAGQLGGRMQNDFAAASVAWILKALIMLLTAALISESLNCGFSTHAYGNRIN
jgi:hypothetical protein